MEGAGLSWDDDVEVMRQAGAMAAAAMAGGTVAFTVEEPPESLFETRGAFCSDAHKQLFECSQPAALDTKCRQRRRRNSKNEGRPPIYNLKQIETWIAGCGDTGSAWGGSKESERVMVYERLCGLLVQLNPKMHTRPSPGCKCRVCSAFCSHLVQEGQLLGYELRLVPGHPTHVCPLAAHPQQPQH